MYTGEPLGAEHAPAAEQASNPAPTHPDWSSLLGALVLSL